MITLYLLLKMQPDNFSDKQHVLCLVFAPDQKDQLINMKGVNFNAHLDQILL